MATDDHISDLPCSAHPLANPGYGKRNAPDQEPLARDSFAHLDVRARLLAGLIDRLPENAAMDAKTLAKSQEFYGQAAVRTALNQLTEAGHLRRVRRVAEHEGGLVRWVSETYWSRTARSSEWWTRFLKGDVPAPEPVPASVPESESESRPKPASASAPAQPPPRSEAYRVLAQLSLRDPRLFLSAAECSALEELAADWLARDPDPYNLTHAMTAGLPSVVHSPRAFVERRLRDKMPPERPRFRPSAARIELPEVPRRPRNLVECTECGVPGRPEAIPDGLCGRCQAAARAAAATRIASSGPFSPSTPSGFRAPVRI